MGEGTFGWLFVQQVSTWGRGLSFYSSLYKGILLWIRLRFLPYLVCSVQEGSVQLGSLSRNLSEHIWVKQFLQKLELYEIQQMKMCCDNQVAIHVASKLVFDERTKHVELDFHFIQGNLLANEICTEFVRSNDQLACVKKSLRVSQIKFICSDFSI